MCKHSNHIIVRNHLHLYSRLTCRYLGFLAHFILARVWGNRASCTCTDVLAEEQAHEAIFQPLPFHYIEVAHLLLRHAKEAFEEADDVLYQVSQCMHDLADLAQLYRSAGALPLR